MNSEDKITLRQHLMGLSKVSADTSEVLCVSDEDFEESIPDEEVLRFMEHFMTNPDKVRVLTCPSRLNAVLTELTALGAQHVRLVALGHYLAEFYERSERYLFVAFTDDSEDDEYFAYVLGTFPIISEFWALGCITARATRDPDYSHTSLIGLDGSVNVVDGNRVDCFQTRILDCTVRTECDVRAFLLKESFLVRIAQHLSDGKQRSQPLIMRGEMQYTVPRRVPGTNEFQRVAVRKLSVQDPVFVNEEMWLAHREELEREYPNPMPLAVVWLWTEEHPFGVDPSEGLTPTLRRDHILQKSHPRLCLE
eukprot:PhF_6_TR14165/c0_g1_i2/m.22659